MNRFKHIQVEGYRRLHFVPLDMRNLAVMIGANGVGKTSFLEVFSLLAASANGQLLERIGGGLESMLTRGKANRLAFSLQMDVPSYQPVKYRLEISPARNSSYQISYEALTQHNDPNL
ncbi:MAG TPA: AAA family ATPase, partial [Blastocatellia bacterium]|nr:AAA family ATPase [Blastocatellia bacterium]